MNKFKLFLLNLVPSKKWRQIIKTHYQTLHTKDFIYKSKPLKLFQSDYNCGYYENRMSERAVEMAITKLWLDKIDGEITELGAVSPYYFPRAVTHVCDPYDSHKSVDLKCSLFDLDLSGKNILCISTIEHIATGDYGVAINTAESPLLALKKILNEASNSLITFPVGVNTELDNYFSNQKYLELHSEEKSIYVTVLTRGVNDNNWQELTDFSKINYINYGPLYANAVVIIDMQSKKE